LSGDEPSAALPWFPVSDEPQESMMVRLGIFALSWARTASERMAPAEDSTSNDDVS
jgi:hypothetical protein